MIKINTQTLEATRESLPKYLHGLDADTLRNLQTVAKPVPPHILNVEYWPENDTRPVINEAVEKYGDEILTVDAANKVVNVSRQVVPLTAQELADKQAELDEISRLAGIDAIRQEVLDDPEVIAIRDMTGDEIAAHFATRTTVSELRDDVIKLTKILVLLAEGK